MCYGILLRLSAATTLLFSRRIVVSCDGSCPKNMSSKCQRLGLITGLDEKRNEVVYCNPSAVTAADTKILVFFGGDVQDYPEAMDRHRDNLKFVQWNLEATALLLSQKFPDRHVLVVRPSSLYVGTFSCYENFVPSNNIGVPNFCREGTTAISHLQLLLTNALSKALDCQSLETVGSSEIALAGFSKGCVVLNQMVHELPNAQSNAEAWPFVGRIRDWYWLDGGHAGSKDTWVTDSEVLRVLAALPGVRIHVHLTPYQVRDPRRPWIRKEEDKFSKSLQRLGAALDRSLHFEEEEPSLDNHFRVLQAFQ